MTKTLWFCSPCRLVTEHKLFLEKDGDILKKSNCKIKEKILGGEKSGSESGKV